VEDDEWLARRFEEHRGHLRAVAQRMLGSGHEADDAVQEAWIRLSRSDAATLENLGGWLTTVVSRVSLDMLRARTSRREEPDGGLAADRSPGAGQASDPEGQAALADSVGTALLLVLDTLSPSERLAFVLRDTFGVPFEQIGPILDRSPNAAKQLASRARQKVRGAATGEDAAVDPGRQRQVVDAFLAASRNGDFEALLALLAPDIVLLADPAAVRMGSPEQTRGAADVAHTFSGRALAAQAAVIDEGIGIVWVVGGRPKVAWDFTIVDGSIVHIDMIASPDHLRELDLTVLG
jgi:RNA polymerase sigma-70 factor (ECF subfamily)